MQRIGILGGMFDPLHTGHIHAALSALAFGLDEVLLCPCQTPSHRSKATASAQHRRRMCEIAAALHPGLTFSDVDLRESVCYAADTAAILHARYPDAELYWIIGADKLPGLPRWHDADKLFQLCRFLVCPRPGYDENAAVPGARLHVLHMTQMQVSSGKILELLRAYNDVVPQLPREISRYIAENGLYQPDFTPQLLQRGMKESRLNHTLGVRQTAVALAYQHGANMQKAAVAAMLHDIAKPLPLAEMQALAEKYALNLSAELLSDGNLLHGPVAAAIVQHELSITDAEILSAIHCHTAGKCGMTALDMCVFLADAIEPTRRPYPGLEEMRALSLENLPAAVLLSMQRTREYVLSQGHHFCSDTEQAMQDITKKISGGSFMSEIRSLAVRAAEILNKFKAQDIVVLDVANATVITEYMVICTARTAQHVKSLCDDVEDKLAEEGVFARKKEGQTEGRWAILDYGGVLVHVFHPEERQYYRLERLWDDGLNHVELTFDNDDEAKPFLS